MSGPVCKVAVSAATYAIDKPYDYLIPAHLVDDIRPGRRVIVPFARANRRSEGLVLSISDESSFTRLKPIDSVVDLEPVLDEGQIRLALWMRERFFCTVYDAVRAMLPTGLWYQIHYRYRLTDGINRPGAEAAVSHAKAALAVLDILFESKGPVEEATIKRALGEKTAATGLRRLLDAEVILCQVDEARRVKDKTQKFIRLAITADEASDLAERKRRSAKKQAEVLDLLATAEEVSAQEIAYYTGAGMQTLNALMRAGVITIEPREVLRRPEHTPRPGAADTILTAEQDAACQGLIALYRNPGPEAALLRGVTGSGKTAVYLHLIDQVINDGKTAIVLVPEIALTPQLMGSFVARFGDRVAVLHSALGLGERYDEWKRIRAGDVSVVVGTRSAVFAPVSNLGVIVIDEEQEHTYKSEQPPRYHARDVAKYRCAQENALLLMGSATPSVETNYGAVTGRYHAFSLPTRFNQMELPQVIIADMRDNLKAGNATNISNELRRELEQNIAAGEQSILFLNRRGTSNLLVCGECGYTFNCENCSVGLTYHRANGRLMCHYCGLSRPVEEACPDCGGILKHVGAGTQKVQEELQELFPETQILRMDTDTVTPSQSHDALFNRFERERIPILVGTQMVAKGLDFPNVTLVGVISADQGLYMGDYRAQERTFSLVTQVVGRAGRGERPGRAVIQTFTPNHEVVTLAANQDYDGFYEREITLRKIQGVPPLMDLISIVCTGQDESAILRCITGIRHTLERRITELGEDAQIIGPAPLGVVKVQNRYRYHVTVRCKQNKQVRAFIAYILQRVPTMKQYRGVTVYGDVDGF
ncbi:MAG: primosomal protein N' [Oscillospiraceae bacterium]|nr:primosomal protein N' [Oscillospiraceae bacterium]